MSASSVKMLKTASEILGGDSALARHLGVSQTILCLYLADTRPLPDALLLRAVDVILEDRQLWRSADRPMDLAKPDLPEP
jgi:hypothetical protein